MMAIAEGDRVLSADLVLVSSGLASATTLRCVAAHSNIALHGVSRRDIRSERGRPTTRKAELVNGSHALTTPGRHKRHCGL